MFVNFLSGHRRCRCYWCPAYLGSLTLHQRLSLSPPAFFRCGIPDPILPLTIHHWLSLRLRHEKHRQQTVEGLHLFLLNPVYLLLFHFCQQLISGICLFPCKLLTAEVPVRSCLAVHRLSKLQVVNNSMGR